MSLQRREMDEEQKEEGKSRMINMLSGTATEEIKKGELCKFDPKTGKK